MNVFIIVETLRAMSNVNLVFVNIKICHNLVYVNIFFVYYDCDIWFLVFGNIKK